MPVREVVLHRDARAPVDLSPRSLLSRYSLRRSFSVILLMALDVGSVIAAAIVVAEILASFTDTTFVGPTGPELAVAAAITVLAFAATGLYGLRAQRHSVRRVLRGALWALLAVVLVTVIVGLDVDRLPLILIWAFALAFALLARTMYDAVLGHVYRDAETCPVVIVGRPGTVERARRLLGASPATQHCRVLGVVSEAPIPRAWQEANGLPMLGVLDNLETVLATEHPAEIVVSDPHLARTHMPAIVEACHEHHVTLKLAAVDVEFGASAVTFVPGYGVPVFVIKPAALGGFSFFVKRACDLIGAAFLLVVLSPFLLTISLLIKLTSPGPVLFADERVGLAQKHFRFFKFRTMVKDAAKLQEELESFNETDGAIFKIRFDPRITPVGRFLRRFSLDELPQLLNVLRGEMSLVGPRPLPLRDFDRLDDWHKQRHVVLPGITGLWQVSGRSDLAFDEMIDLDFRYIENWSLGSDLGILLRTFGAVFAARGAY